MDDKEFLRAKIYEKLDYQPKPDDYKSNIPWIVQQQIAATNGIHYVDKIGKLKEYPIYKLPVPKVRERDKLMLDIGFGWGRWLIAGAKRGYIPLGLDIRLEFAQTALKVMKDLGIKGYVVVADLGNIPFKDSIFDLVWSFSVIQHTHYTRLVNTLKDIHRILKSTGFTKLQFPNRNGLRNRIKYVPESDKRKHDINSWVVRYYSIEEYKKIIGQYFDIKRIEIHSFLGLGILFDDLKYVSWKNKFLVSAVLLSTFLAKILGLKQFADSLYITAEPKNKEKSDNINALKEFIKLHNSGYNNLNILPLLKCPISGGDLIYDKANSRLISEKAKVYYPVIDDIPILVDIEARKL